MTIVSCMLLAGITMMMPAASASTEAEPMVQTLLAGQTIPVGTVQVWNDEDTLHVLYTITAPWKMSQCHLMVASSLSEIPQTASGNPIPGKFTWGQEFRRGVSSAEFTISLSENNWDSSTWVFIAAHAVVYKKYSCNSETAWAKGCGFEVIEVKDSCHGEKGWSKACGSGVKSSCHSETTWSKGYNHGGNEWGHFDKIWGKHGHGKGNWATWFSYHVEGWVFTERVALNSNNILGENSAALSNGALYKFKVSGTWNNGYGGVVEATDAMYTSLDAWATHNDAPKGPLYPPYVLSYDPNEAELQVEGQFVNWGAYSATHQYTLKYTGDGSAVNFMVFEGDAMTNTQYASWYGNNVGVLFVDIYIWA